MTRSPEMPPLTVAAVVICFNQGRFLEASLGGLLGQSRPPDQVVIIDDCSTDDSADRLRAWVARHRPDATLVLHQTNRGVIRTLNEAFALVTCDLVAPLAGDDLWLPGKLATQVAQLELLPTRVGVLYGDVGRIDERGDLLVGSFIESYKGRALRPEGNLFGELLRGNFLPSPSLLIRRACWERVGHFDESLYMEDWDFWLRVARHYEFGFTSEEVGRYRVVTGSHVRQTGPVADASHLATLLKWSHTPELRSPAARETVRALAASLYGQGGAPARRRLAWVWVRHGGVRAWLRSRLPQTPHLRRL